MALPKNPDQSLEFVTALARGLSVLRSLNDARKPLTLTETAQQLGLPRAAVRRSLHTLQQLGYVESDGRSYSPTIETLNLGANAINHQPFSEAAQPLLIELSRLIGESCSVSVLTGECITYIARVSTSRIMSINLQVGTQLPAYCSSMGRVLLASLPDTEQQRILQGVQLKALTPYTITDPQGLSAELRQVREQGYALIDQELELGLRSVAVPIFNRQHQVKAALNAGTNAAQRSVADLLAFIPHLQAAASQLGALDYLNRSTGRSLSSD